MSLADVVPQAGHRQRLLQRFAEGGFAGFLNYEIIELLLSYALPRRDVKPIAKDLIRHYGTVGAILQAEQGELAAFCGLGERSTLLFSLIREIAAISLKEQSLASLPLIDRQLVEDYLRFHFGGRRDEFVVALLLSSSHNLLAVRELGGGTVNQCAVYPRVVMEYALREKAAGIILAHNHPGGNPTPSDADWKVTDRLHRAGKVLEIPLHDHFIIVADRILSLRELPRWPK